MEPFGAQTIREDKRTVHCGYLKKYNPAGKAQKRFCIINFGTFLYYKEQNSVKPQGYFSLSGYVGAVGEGDTQFVIKHFSDPTKRTYTFKTFYKEDREIWLRSIRDCVFRYYTASLHKESDERSEEYDYIARDLVMKALPRKTVDARKEIVSGFVGPSYNASLTCPSNSTFVPDTPPEIPERIYPPSYKMPDLSSNIPDNDQGYVCVDGEPESSYESMTGNERHSQNITGVNIANDGYVSMEKSRVGTNSMTDHYVSMTSESHYEDMDQLEEGPVYMPPNIHLLYEQVIDFSSEDDEDAADDDDLEQCPDLVEHQTANSSNVESIIVDKIRSASLNEAMPQKAHRKVERLVTAPALTARESQEKRPIPAPRPRYLGNDRKSVTNDGKNDPNVLPESCFFRIARDQCLEHLYQYPVGTYLIRTGREDGKDALAVLARDNPPKVRHFIVFENEREKYLAKEEEKFSSLVKLIKHYYTETLPLTELKLVQPWKAC